MAGKDNVIGEKKQSINIIDLRIVDATDEELETILESRKKYSLEDRI